MRFKEMAIIPDQRFADGLFLALGARRFSATRGANAVFRPTVHRRKSARKSQYSFPSIAVAKCEIPQFSMPSSARRWGTLSVLVQCPQDKRYLQVEVQVTGGYPVASAPLSRGQHISAADFNIMQGRLDRLPTGSIMEISQLDNAVLTRDVAAGQPVTSSMMRRTWIIKAGQSVQILAQGDGFNVTSEGKALNNAAIADNVRVRLASGQIISGKATEQGTIELLM